MWALHAKPRQNIHTRITAVDWLIVWPDRSLLHPGHDAKQTRWWLEKQSVCVCVFNELFEKLWSLFINLYGSHSGCIFAPWCIFVYVNKCQCQWNSLRKCLSLKQPCGGPGCEIDQWESNHSPAQEETDSWPRCSQASHTRLISWMRTCMHALLLFYVKLI